MLTEVECPEQDIEAQEVGEYIPHVLRQPQMIGVHYLRQQIRRSVGRGHLIGGHTTKQSIGPTASFTSLLKILDTLLTSTTSCRGIMTIKDSSLDVCREEIGKSQNGEQ